MKRKNCKKKKKNLQNSAKTVPSNFVLLLSRNLDQQLGIVEGKKKNKAREKVYDTLETREGRKFLRR